ncbi:hypothetical protein F0Q53_03675 [Anaplasma marginale]|uniref:Rod shape-determining protein MreD n=2 Tax=Anaplasma TaxID=768 RepID=D1ASJ7_ANACI|nr:MULTISPECIES: hypothetical protein [Anaplasma]ACZ49450.1 hypothetical protein ACIS_00948 [Anaplasma centrale str. Israel]KAA8473895.1 hypothetical protein F0Q53_03675 [Anaplasma marginale]KAB0451577.1 hypothetical protein FY207_03855 [Anaplasma marginale]
MSANCKISIVRNAFIAVLMLALVLCEFLLSGVMHKFTPRFDILLMVFARSRNIPLANLPLFIVGVFRDIIYFFPVGGSSIFYVAANIVLSEVQKRLSGNLGVVISLFCVNGIQWIVWYMTLGEASQIFYLGLQMLWGGIAHILASRNWRRRYSILQVRRPW